MAEFAPLPAAHTHARRAAVETQLTNWKAAADEHQHAASDFARAARCTSDSEALRILRLLEEEHQKLARIIRLQEVADPAESSASDAPAMHVPSANADANVRTQSKLTTVKTTTSAMASTRLGSQVRDSSPTLAREIASRRGIPQPTRGPASAAVQARARQLSPESRRRSRPNPAAKIPPSIMDSQASLRDVQHGSNSEDDDAFTKFYSNLTTGTMSKLSSVLAYAGLPLNPSDQQVEHTQRSGSERPTVSAGHEPDVKAMFSKAALEALEDEHRKRGSRGHVFGPAESFYVVQRGGGTYSYADIAKAQQQQLAGVDEDDEQDFEDAREAQAPSPPRNSGNVNPARDSFGKSRTHEELELENVTLKQTLEQVAQRLSEFETHAQDASMAALTQSMISNPAAAADSSPALIGRLRQLEKQLQEQANTQQTLQDTLNRRDQTVRKYRSMFEDIKKSAKEKEKAKREKAKKDAEGGVAASVEVT